MSNNRYTEYQNELEIKHERLKLERSDLIEQISRVLINDIKIMRNKGHKRNEIFLKLKQKMMKYDTVFHNDYVLISLIEKEGLI